MLIATAVVIRVFGSQHYITFDFHVDNYIFELYSCYNVTSTACQHVTYCLNINQFTFQPHRDRIILPGQTGGVDCNANSEPKR